jgi:hypothetical protein
LLNNYFDLFTATIAFFGSGFSPFGAKVRKAAKENSRSVEFDFPQGHYLR